MLTIKFGGHKKNIRYIYYRKGNLKGETFNDNQNYVSYKRREDEA